MEYKKITVENQDGCLPAEVRTSVVGVTPPLLHQSRSLLQSYLGTPAGVKKVQLTQVKITGIVRHAKRGPRLPANAAISQLPVSIIPLCQIVLLTTHRRSAKSSGPRPGVRHKQPSHRQSKMKNEAGRRPA